MIRLLACLLLSSLPSFAGPVDELVKAISNGDAREIQVLLSGRINVNAVGGPKRFTPLMAAALMGNTTLLRLLIKKGASVNPEPVEPHHATPLMLAAASGEVASVKLLLESGANVSAVDRAGDTALAYAAREGGAAAVEALITAGARVNAQNNDGYTPLMHASWFGEKEQVETILTLLRHGADTESQEKDEGLTAIHIALERMNLDNVLALTRHKADVNARLKNGRNPLVGFLASGIGGLNEEGSRRRLEVLKALLTSGADPNTSDTNGRSLLHIAAAHYLPEFSMALIKAGANVNASTKSGYTPLMEAASQGFADTCGLLIQHGADVNTKDRQGRSALTLAEVRRRNQLNRTVPDQTVVKEYQATVDVLKAKGARFSAEDLELVAKNERPPSPPADRLVEAFGRKNIDAVKLALKDGADANASYERVPLVAFLAASGNLQFLDLLLDSGASPIATSPDGNTVLMWAAMPGQVNVVRRLLERGAIVSAQNAEGETALYQAAKYGRTKTAKLLIDKGANPNIATKAGRTPLMAAAENGYWEVLDLLLQSGADPNRKDTDGHTALEISQRSGLFFELMTMGPVTFTIAEQAERDLDRIVRTLRSVRSK